MYLVLRVSRNQIALISLSWAQQVTWQLCHLSQTPRFPHFEDSCSQIKHIKTNPIHNSSLVMNLDGFIAHKNNRILDRTHTHDNIQCGRFPHTTLPPTWWSGTFDKEDVLPLNKLPRSHNKMLTPNDSQLIVTEQTDYPLKQRHLQSGLE